MKALWSILAVLALPIGASAISQAVAQPLPGLTAAENAAWFAGMEAFHRAWTEKEGLGPYFNQQACANCHLMHKAGGGYAPSHVLLYGNRRGRRAAVLHERALPGVSPERLPDWARTFEMRKVPQLFGLGLVEAIPDEDLRRIAEQNGGRVISGPGGRVNRFGAQNQATGLREIVVACRARVSSPAVAPRKEGRGTAACAAGRSCHLFAEARRELPARRYGPCRER